MRLAKCVTDTDMRILEVTQDFADILRERNENLVGRSVYDITHPDDLPPNRRFLDRLRQMGTAFSITKRYNRADGSTVWVNNHVSLYHTQTNCGTIVETVQPVEAPAMVIDGQSLLKTAQRLLRKRSIRPKYFGTGVFGEPEYDILLDLYVNGLMKRSVSMSSACLASGVPATTALRYISGLVARGWVMRTNDARDRRRSTLALTADSADRITRYLDECRRE